MSAPSTPTAPLAPAAVSARSGPLGLPIASHPASGKPESAQTVEALNPSRRSGPLGPLTTWPQAAKSQAAPPPTAQPAQATPAAAQPSGQPAAQTPAPAGGRDRRAASRHEVDTSAIILLVNIGAKIKGRIIDLSLGGCRIRTEERFPVGIYTRIETDFFLEGMPFRLGGVVQAIQGKDLVGIRFLDMSERKKDQLKQLISEIDEMEAKKKLAEGAKAPVSTQEAVTGDGAAI